MQRMAKMAKVAIFKDQEINFGEKRAKVLGYAWQSKVRPPRIETVESVPKTGSD